MAAIAVMLMNMFFSIGILLAVIVVARWGLTPLINLMRYLATHRELGKRRTRAVATSMLAAGILIVALGLVRMPDRCRIEGVVEPSDYAIIHMKTAGFVNTVLESGRLTGPRGPELVRAANPELEARHDRLMAENRRLHLKRQSAQTKEPAATQIVEEKIAALEEQISRIQQEMADLTLHAPVAGVWVSPDADRLMARRLDQGERIGVVADLDRLRIRAVANQQVASRLIAEGRKRVAIRVKHRPDIELTGRIEKIIPSGQDQLPSAALGYAAGGATRIHQDDPTGRRAAEPFFEVLVIPDPPNAAVLRPGQTMALRIETTPKPLLAQGWRAVLQLFQRRESA